MAKMFVKVDMFTINQDVFLEHGGEIKHIASVPTDKLGEIVYSLVNSKDGIEEIEIDGNQKYIEKIGQEVLEGLNKNYSNNVRVKLNGKVSN